MPKDIDSFLKQIGVEVQQNYSFIGVKEFLSKELPKKEFIIEPFFPRQGLVMIYAMRGIGKTYFALLLAYKIAQGKNVLNDKWKVPKKKRVLYIDGEMSGIDMQSRISSLTSGDVDDLPSENLAIITRDIQLKGIMPNICSPEDQLILDDIIKDFDVVIIDNLSTLALGGKENEANSWDPVSEWLLRLRSLGKSVIFIHHAGKNNTQRGTSKKEDILGPSQI